MAYKNTISAALITSGNVSLPTSDVSALTFTTGAVVRQVLKVNVTSAQLKALPGAPVSLIVAPGANKFISVKSFIFQYRFVTPAYTIGNPDNALPLVYHGTAVIPGSGTAFLVATGFMNQSVNMVSSFDGSVNAATTQTSIVNLGIDLTLTGTTPALTAGNGTLEIVIEYDVIDLS